MRKQPRPVPPKRRSPVPPPGHPIEDVSYNRRDDKDRLRKAISDFQQETFVSPIRLAIFDLEGTLWTVEDGCCSLMTPPFQKLDSSTVADSIGNKLELKTGVRKVFQWLRSKDILISIATRNDKKIVFDILKMLKLFDFVVCPQAVWQRKLFLIRAIRDEIYDKLDLKLDPGQMLLVDDSESNVLDADSMGIRTALIGQDIRSIKDLPAFIAALR